MSGLWDEEEAFEDEEDFEPKTAWRRRRGPGGQPGDEQRGSWYLLTGLIIGLAIGLLISWVISPVQYTNIDPSFLSTTAKDDYRRMIALAYESDHDLGRARERLKLLDPGNPVQVLAAQAQRMVAENQPPQQARALAVLAADLGKPGGSSVGQAVTQAAQPVAGVNTPGGALTAAAETAAPAPGSEMTLEPTTEPASAGEAVQTPTLPEPTQTPTATLAPSPTSTPRPTATPLPVMEAPFTLKSKREICDGSMRPALLEILVTDANGSPMPGVRILATWQNGEDTFYTGLAPEINLGYADFQMQPGTLYNLKVGDASDPVNNLKTSETCGWKLEFTQKTNGN